MAITHCIQCGESRDNGYYARCRACHNAKRREHRAGNRERDAEARRRKAQELAVTVGDVQRECRICHEPFRLTPARAANRVGVCSRCKHQHYPGLRDTHARKLARDPKKLQARQKMFWAVKSGKVIPQPCERCGTAKAQAHHDDYDKPLEVRWLCQKCHGLEHFPPATGASR